MATQLGYADDADGARIHHAPRIDRERDTDGQPIAPPGGDWVPSCYGAIRALYTRLAAGPVAPYGRGARPVKWAKVAAVCTRCGAFWPETELLEFPAE